MVENRLLVVRCCAKWLLVSAAVIYSALASALGLGEITLHSALNQPLKADIALVDVAGVEEGELSISLATADEFSRAGVDRVLFLNDLKFTPILRVNRNVIRVTSSKPVNEPFLNFLVQLNQPNGRLLREYTVLIDPPGSPGILPASDEPSSARSSSAFPSVQPAIAPAPARKEPPKPAPAPVIDPLAEQLAASVLQNQQMQATIDELNGKLQAQNEQIAGDKKQVTELQTQLAELKQAPVEAVAPVTSTPAPMAIVEPETNWLMIGLLLGMVVLALLAVVLRQRKRDQESVETTADQSPTQGPLFHRIAEPVAHASVLQPVHAHHHEETPANDVLEAVGIYLTYGRLAEAAALLREAMLKEPQRSDLAMQLLEVLGKQGDAIAYDTLESRLRDTGFDVQKLQELRAHHPKLSPIAPAVVATSTTMPVAALTSGDEFQLNLEDLSIEADQDVVSPFDNPASLQLSAENVADIEWEIEPVSKSQDDSFLEAFAEPGQLLELEPLNLDPPESGNVGKLEQAQTCIDDGDLDSAIELLNELLEDTDESLKRTARNLLAGLS